MNKFSKIIFFIEVAVFCTPAILMFTVGVIMLPFQIVILFSHFEWTSLAYVLGYLIGVMGLASLVIVSRYIINPNVKMPNR